MAQTTRPSMVNDVLSGLLQAFSLKPMPKADYPVTVTKEWNPQANRWDLVIRIASWLVPNLPSR